MPSRHTITTFTTGNKPREDINPPGARLVDIHNSIQLVPNSRFDDWFAIIFNAPVFAFVQRICNHFGKVMPVNLYAICPENILGSSIFTAMGFIMMKQIPHHINGFWVVYQVLVFNLEARRKHSGNDFLAGKFGRKYKLKEPLI